MNTVDRHLSRGAIRLPLSARFRPHCSEFTKQFAKLAINFKQRYALTKRVSQRHRSVALSRATFFAVIQSRDVGRTEDAARREMQK